MKKIFSYKRRKGILLAAAGRNGQIAFHNMEKDLECAFTILNMKLEGSVLCAFTDTQPNYEQAIKNFKINLGLEVFQNSSNKNYSDSFFRENYSLHFSVDFMHLILHGCLSKQKKPSDFGGLKF